jgi:hypothetical protein
MVARRLGLMLEEQRELNPVRLALTVELRQTLTGLRRTPAAEPAVIPLPEEAFR